MNDAQVIDKVNELCGELKEYIKNELNPYIAIVIDVNGVKIVETISFTPNSDLPTLKSDG